MIYPKIDSLVSMLSGQETQFTGNLFYVSKLSTLCNDSLMTTGTKHLFCSTQQTNVLLEVILFIQTDPIKRHMNTSSLPEFIIPSLLDGPGIKDSRCHKMTQIG